MIHIIRPESISNERLSEIDAYEYTDLEVFKTHFLTWLEDAQVIKRRKRHHIIDDVMTFDIETTTISARTQYNQTDQSYAVPYLYQVYVAGMCLILRYDAEFMEFYNWIDQAISDKAFVLPVYVHNLSFEYHFLKSRVPIDFNTVFALQSRRIGKFESAKGGLEFRCSYLLSNMSLEKFTSNYCDNRYRKDKDLIDYEILRFPWTDLNNEVLYYSAMDVITLYHAVITIIRKEGDNLKSVPMTNTGYVRRACRTACIGNNTKHYRTEAEKKTYAIFRRYRAMFLKCAPTYEQYEKRFAVAILTQIGLKWGIYCIMSDHLISHHPIRQH